MCTKAKASYQTVQYEYVYRYTPTKKYENLLFGKVLTQLQLFLILIFFLCTHTHTHTHTQKMNVKYSIVC